MARLRSPGECDKITSDFAKEITNESKRNSKGDLYFEGIDIYMEFVNSADKWLQKVRSCRDADKLKLFGFYDPNERHDGK